MSTRAKNSTAVSLEDLQLLIRREVERVLENRLRSIPQGIARARERGIVYMDREFASPESLTLQEVAKLLGHSETQVDLERSAGRYYALSKDGRSPVFRYPKWQFDADSGRLARVLHSLTDLGASCWSIHSFLHYPQLQLDGACPRDWILDAERNLERLVELIHARFGAN